MSTTARERARYICAGRVMPDNQNSVSSIAYQYTRGIGGPDVRRLSSTALRAVLADLGVADPKAPPWKATLPNGVELEAVVDGTVPVTEAPKRRTPAEEAAPSSIVAAVVESAKSGPNAEATKATNARKAKATTTPAHKGLDDVSTHPDALPGERPSEQVMRNLDATRTAAAEKQAAAKAKKAAGSSSASVSSIKAARAKKAVAAKKAAAPKKQGAASAPLKKPPAPRKARAPKA